MGALKIPCRSLRVFIACKQRETGCARSTHSYETTSRHHIEDVKHLPDSWYKAHRWGLKIVTLVRQPCDQLFRRTHFRHGFEGAESTFAPFCVKGPENRPGRAVDRWIHQNSWQSREVLLRANLFAFALHQRRPPFQRNRHIAAQRHRDLSDKIALQ